MRRFSGYVGLVLIAAASQIMFVELAPRLSAPACALLPQATGLERSLEQRIIGACIASPILASNGDTIQPTTTGLIVVRRIDGRAAFTDGLRTWIDGPSGIRRRMNGDHFDWETATRDTRPVGATTSTNAGRTLDECIEPAVRLSPVLRERCLDLVREVIEATERRASGPLLTPGTHHVLSDWRGVPIAYIDDGTNAYRYDGRAFLYVDRDLVFTYPGRFVGWIVDGVIRGSNGDAVLVVDGSPSAPPHPPTSPEPRRTPHGSPPKRGQRTIPSLQAPFTSMWTHLEYVGLTL
jgi:hypothetical protein